MNPARTAIFIEPQGALLEALRERKAWLEQTMPRQAFTRHPPHVTLLFGDYGPPDQWLSALRTRVARQPAFTLMSDCWREFPNDLQAAGGHTVAYQIQVSSALLALQLAVAETLAVYRVPSPTPHPLADREPFATSLRLFGFPFVGPHWIPHFTVGSPRVSPLDPLLRNLMAASPLHASLVQSVTLWRVRADEHERLSELALAPAAS